MTDEEIKAMTLSEMLTEVADCMDGDLTASGNPGWHPDYVNAVRCAALRLTEPPPGSIAVRIAVAMDADGFHEIALCLEPGKAGELLDDCRQDMDDEITHEAIIVAHIPPRVVPEVTGTVEPFDPEATI